MGRGLNADTITDSINPFNPNCPNPYSQDVRPKMHRQVRPAVGELRLSLRGGNHAQPRRVNGAQQSGSYLGPYPAGYNRVVCTCAACSLSPCRVNP